MEGKKNGVCENNIFFMCIFGEGIMLNEFMILFGYFLWILDMSNVFMFDLVFFFSE